MEKKMSIRTKEILTTGLGGLFFCGNGIYFMFFRGTLILSITIDVLLILNIICSIVLNRVTSEPWDELCREEWLRASARILDFAPLIFIIYSAGLLFTDFAIFKNPGLPMLLAGLLVLSRTLLFLKYEGRQALEEE